MEVISLLTKDNLKIVGDWYYKDFFPNGILLFHMMPSDRSSWFLLSENLVDLDFQVLAIDLRGHGQSQVGPDGYRNFSDQDHQASILDVEAAADFLKSKGVESLYIGGASLGANLALWYTVKHPKVKAVFLLSPGFDYRGIEARPLASSLNSGQAVFMAGSTGDIRSSGLSAAEMVSELYRLVPDGVKKKKVAVDGQYHGTDMLGGDKSLSNEIITWLIEQKM